MNLVYLIQATIKKSGNVIQLLKFNPAAWKAHCAQHGKNAQGYNSTSVVYQGEVFKMGEKPTASELKEYGDDVTLFCKGANVSLSDLA